MKYPFLDVEKKWQEFWEENKINSTDLSDTEKKLYTLSNVYLSFWFKNPYWSLV